MSTFINSDITDSGRLLIAKNYLGQKMNFTRIVMGDGYLAQDESPRKMTDVVNAVVDVPITKMKINADGTVVIGGVFSNSEISTEFFYRELALFAEGEDGTEVLYCYGNAGEFAERITPVGGSSVIEKSIDIVTAIGTTENITATIVRTQTADEISYNDNISKLGAVSVQEAVEILARKNVESSATVIISDTEPTTPCEIWLKPTGNIEYTLPPPIDEDGEAGETPNETGKYNFYLAHYYDKENAVFVPFMYTNLAQNVLLYPGREETVAEVIAHLQDSKTYTLSELFAHISDTEVHVNAVQIQNALGAIAELIGHTESGGIHVTPEKKAYWDGGAVAAAEARGLAEQLGEKTNQHENRIARLEDGLFNNITGNPFLISFDDLSGISIVKGVWNKELQRIEC